MMRAPGLPLAALLLLLVAAHAGRERFECTGDEPSYAASARQFHDRGRFDAPPDHAVFWSIVLSPLAGAASVEPLRGAVLVVSLAGLAAIHGLARRAAPAAAAFLAVAGAAFAVPGFAYQGLFYMEGFSMALIALAWLAMQGEPLRWPRLLAAAALIGLLPFTHFRNVATAAALALMLLARVWRQPAAPRARAARIVAALAVFAFAAGAYALMQQRLYGWFLGGTGVALGLIQPSRFAGSLLLQLFSVRHGLLVFAPVWALALAGLLQRLVRDRDRLAIEAALLLAAGLVTMVWHNPSECYPARFWVALLPVLACGLAWWLARPHGAGDWIAAGALALLTVVNAVDLYMHAGLFLCNRQSSLTYDLLYERFPFFHFGYALPLHAEGGVKFVRYASHFAVLHVLGAFLVAFLLLQTLPAAFERPRVRRGCGALTLLLVLALADLSRASNPPRDRYTVSVARDPGGPRRVTVRCAEPCVPALLRIAPPTRYIWSASNGVVRTGVSDAALRDYAIEPPAPRLGFRKPVRAQAIEVTVPADVELYRPEEMTLLASRSLIRRALSR